MEICESIKTKRTELGLSHKDFADALGMGKYGDITFRRWENGETTPSQAEFNAIMNFAEEIPFDCSVDQALFTFIDLFAGIGGIRIPFQELGGKCVFTSEWDKFAQKTYRINFGDEPQGDITQITNKDIPDFDILLGGFPCQPFSQAGLHKGIEDTRGTLFFHVARIIEGKRPKAFLLENVKQLVGHDGGRTFKTVIETLERLDYAVTYKVLRARDFGVPQNRQRIYIVGFDKQHFDIPEGFKFEFPEPPCTPTCVGDILEDNVDEKYTISNQLWAGHLRRKAANKASGKGFGYTLYTAESKFTNTLSARYYKDGSEILIDQGNEKNPRKLTPRECARLQGFPDNFIIPVSDTQAYKQFGNSVAVPVIRAIARKIVSVMRTLYENHGESTVPIDFEPDENLCNQIYTKVAETSKAMNKFSLIDCTNQRAQHIESGAETTICILAVEKSGKYEPVVVPNDWKKVSRHANDYIIVSGNDATEIYGKYGIYISKLQRKSNTVQVIRISMEEYNELVMDLEELTDRLISEVETAIDIIADEKNIKFSTEERNSCFSKTIMKIFSNNPAIESKTLITSAI